MTHTDAFKIVFAIASEQSDAQFFAELSELIERKTARLTYLKRLDLIEWADKYGDAAASFKMIVETLMKNDYTRKRYNPIKEYFNELPPYDPNEGDYIQQLLSFITVPSERKRFDVQMKKALVRTVACALRVIRFNKECIILQGKQDDGKSSFLSSLMPKSLGTKYYYDAFNPENKDDVKRMAMCLLINIDEMASLSKKDINQIKNDDGKRQNAPTLRRPRQRLAPRRHVFWHDERRGIFDRRNRERPLDCF